MKFPGRSLCALALLTSTCAFCAPSSEELCRELGGSAIRASIKGSKRHVLLCQFGRTVIRAKTLRDVVVDEREREAVTLYWEHLEVPNDTRSGGPNPASYYCKQLGGQLVRLNPQEGLEADSLCQFIDGSMIDEWTLFRGPEHAVSVPLNHALIQTR